MTRSQLVAIMLARLGRRNDTLLQVNIETELQNVQETVCEQRPSLPWFLLSEMTDANTTAGEDRIELPGDFLMESDEEEGALWYYDSTNEDNQWILLTKDSEVFLKATQSGTGAPVAYALAGEYLIVKPTPDDTYPMRFKYFKKDELLTGDNSDNQWMKFGRNCLMYETLAVVAREYMKDEASAAGFEARAAENWERLRRAEIARQEAGRDRQMGDE